MPAQERVRREYDTYHFGTYGALGKVYVAETLNESRARSWSNSSYRTARLRALQIQKAGFLPTQPYVDNLQQVVNSRAVTATGRLNSDPSSTFIWKFIPGVDRLACSLTDSRVLSARAEVLEKLQSSLSGVGVSVPLTILEAGKTADMIGECAMRVLKAYRHVRHHNFKAAALALGLRKEDTPRRVGRHKSVEENWLEYRYGWRLVVYDITSYMKQIHDMLITKPVVLRVNSRVTKTYAPYTYVLKDLYLGPNSTYYNMVTYDRYGSTTRNISATAGYVYSLESVALSVGQELGLLNPFSVAWDFLPGSFMVDWAVNVSSVLEGFSAFQGKKFLDGYVTLAHQTTRQEYWKNVRKGSSIAVLNPDCTFFSPEVVERRFSRSALSSFQPASLRLDFSASFKNGLDGLALIKQVFSRRS